MTTTSPGKPGPPCAHPHCGKAPERHVREWSTATHATLKPIIDGLGSRSVYNGRKKVHPAYGMFVDDNSAHLDGPHITIGPPLPTLRNQGIHGFVRLDITELEA